jgi:hypothetical protein
VIDQCVLQHHTTTLLTGFYFFPKNPFMSLRSSHRMVFCAGFFSCPVGSTGLALFRFAGVIVT